MNQFDLHVRIYCPSDQIVHPNWLGEHPSIDAPDGGDQQKLGEFNATLDQDFIWISNEPLPYVYPPN